MPEQQMRNNPVNIHTFLREQMDQVNGWLRYAEAKNAILLGFSGGGLGLVIQDFCANPITLKCLFQDIGILLLVLSTLNTLFSFTPIYELNWLLHLSKNRNKYGSPSDNDSLIFYKHIAKYKPDIFLRVVSDRYFNASTTSNLMTDIAGQLVANSRIAVLKFRYFERGILEMLFGIIFILISYILGD